MIPLAAPEACGSRMPYEQVAVDNHVDEDQAGQVPRYLYLTYFSWDVQKPLLAIRQGFRGVAN